MHLTSLPGGRLGPEAYRFADWLAAAGQSWWQVLPLGPPDRYRSPYKSKSAFAAWPGFLSAPEAPVSTDEVDAFVARNAFWIEDWGRLAGGRRAIEDQVRFDTEWAALRRYCEERGIRLFGDVAIYVAPGSVDQRAHPELFQDGFVAGAPPDAFSDDGQLWGNPLYDWPALRRRGYRWWVERARRTLELFDVARIDHFRGFVAYWSVAAGSQTAVDGRWVRGPGRAVFDAIAAGLDGALPFVAEDLGVITPPVDRLRDALGLPGMVVLQFGFEPDVPGSVHRLANHLSHRFVYTGTHDHDTARGWWEGLDSGAAGARARRSARVRAQRVDVGARARAVVGADPARAVLAGVRRDDADAGCPRARLRGADEQPGAPGRPVALADGVRCLDAGAGTAVAGCDGGGRPVGRD